MTAYFSRLGTLINDGRKSATVETPAHCSFTAQRSDSRQRGGGRLVYGCGFASCCLQMPRLPSLTCHLKGDLVYSDGLSRLHTLHFKPLTEVSLRSGLSPFSVRFQYEGRTPQPLCRLWLPRPPPGSLRSWFWVGTSRSYPPRVRST